jgi:hypothetical protein
MDDPSRTMAQIVAGLQNLPRDEALNGHGRRQHVDANCHVRTIGLAHGIPSELSGDNARGETCGRSRVRISVVFLQATPIATT